MSVTVVSPLISNQKRRNDTYVAHDVRGDAEHLHDDHKHHVMGNSFSFGDQLPTNSSVLAARGKNESKTADNRTLEGPRRGHTCHVHSPRHCYHD